MMIKDSGNRREYETGAVRDNAEGKGRCDWLRGDDDERHDRAFVWNIMCPIWTHEHITNKQPVTDKRCVETDCYFNDDYCFCTSHNESCNPARGKECAGYSAD